MARVDDVSETQDAEDRKLSRLIGTNIRVRRKRLSITQSQLAAALGVTFQQVQKYEKGVNRVSAPILWRTAKVLRCSLEDLFHGAQGDEQGDGRVEIIETPEAAAMALLAAPGGMELAETYLAIGNAQRRALLEVGKAMAGTGAESAS